MTDKLFRNCVCWHGPQSSETYTDQGSGNVSVENGHLIVTTSVGGPERRRDVKVKVPTEVVLEMLPELIATQRDASNAEVARLKRELKETRDRNDRLRKQLNQKAAGRRPVSA